MDKGHSGREVGHARWAGNGMGFGNVQVSNEKGPLVGLGDLLGIVLPSYVGIVRNQRNHHRDPY